MEQAVRKIALLGMGTVGGGVYEIIERQKEEMDSLSSLFSAMTRIDSPNRRNWIKPVFMVK